VLALLRLDCLLCARASLLGHPAACLLSLRSARLGTRVSRLAAIRLERA